METSLPGVHLRPRLLAAGITDREIRRLQREGEITIVRRGAYAVSADVPAEQYLVSIHQHLLAVQAAVANLAPGTVISHESAAVVHGLPLWGVPLDLVHATRNRASGARRSSEVSLHAAVLDAGDVTDRGGIPATSPARAILDMGRTLSLDQALVPADAALHRKLVTPDDLLACLDRAARRPGNSRARRLVAFADGLAESPGESLSRLAIQRSGLPRPTLQRPVRSVGGRSLGRVDFWWEELGVVGEFDGQVKYGRLLRPGQDPGEAVYEEKLREDAIRATGVGFVRWTWAEIFAFDAVATRIRAARR